jgi:SAM-dependent methyltransferase
VNRSVDTLSETMDAITLRNAIEELGAEQFWNHSIELRFGISTAPKEQISHGKNLVKWQRIKPILDAIVTTDMSVLDIGCNEGFFSQQLAQQAKAVLGGDIDRLRIKKARFVNSILQTGNLTFQELDIYSTDFSALDHFDLCICMGLLHRVPDPYRAVSAIGAKSNIVIFEWKALKAGHHIDPIAYFSQKEIDHSDFYGTEYWLLSYKALESILQREGFKFFHRVDDPKQRRAILVAGKINNTIFSRPDQIFRRNRLLSLASHTKKYISTIVGILKKEINY